ncbi:hypothetical protein HK096_001327, partial [Nowakowskiella sp. JEL0078]
ADYSYPEVNIGDQEIHFDMERVTPVKPPKSIIPEESIKDEPKPDEIIKINVGIRIDLLKNVLCNSPRIHLKIAQYERTVPA